jgi:hypothetical protein
MGMVAAWLEFSVASACASAGCTCCCDSLDGMLLLAAEQAAAATPERASIALTHSLDCPRNRGTPGSDGAAPLVGADGAFKLGGAVDGGRGGVAAGIGIVAPGSAPPDATGAAAGAYPTKADAGVAETPGAWGAYITAVPGYCIGWGCGIM